MALSTSKNFLSGGKSVGGNTNTLAVSQIDFKNEQLARFFMSNFRKIDVTDKHTILGNT